LPSISSGIPDYLSYVRATPTQKKATEALGPLSSVPDYTPHPENADGWRTLFFDGPTDETRFPHPDAGGVKAKGDSSIIYRTEMIGVDQEGGDRFDALEVSTVIGYERD
jgi:catechol O-methyltransferase